MPASQRLISAALLVVFASLVTGCSSINVPSWDPTDLMDFLDTKKRAVGERKPVFPDGVPGVRQGVPAEYVRGTPEHQAAMAAGDPTLAPPQVVEAPPEPAKPQKKRVGSKPVTVTPNQSDEPVADDADEVPPPASPPPPRKRTAKKPVAEQAVSDQDAQSAPAQQSQSTFQRPLPSGSFQR